MDIGNKCTTEWVLGTSIVIRLIRLNERKSLREEMKYDSIKTAAWEAGLFRTSRRSISLKILVNELPSSLYSVGLSDGFRIPPLNCWFQCPAHSNNPALRSLKLLTLIPGSWPSNKPNPGSRKPIGTPHSIHHHWIAKFNVYLLKANLSKLLQIFPSTEGFLLKTKCGFFRLNLSFFIIIIRKKSYFNLLSV